MSGPGSAREALIVEALGDVAKLLDRVDGVVSALEMASKELERTGAKLQADAVAWDARITLLSDKITTAALHYIARRAHDVASDLNSSLNRDIRALAEGLFEKELRGALQRLNTFIDSRIAERRLRSEWWINLAVFCTAVAATYTLTVHLLGQ